MASKIAAATAAQVREFLNANPVEGETVGKRGRFKPSQVERFNEAHKGVMRYTEGAEVPTVPLKVSITSKSGKTRKETRMFTKGEVRALATEGGVPSVKGPLSKAALEAAAEAYKG